MAKKVLMKGNEAIAEAAIKSASFALYVTAPAMMTTESAAAIHFAAKCFFFIITIPFVCRKFNYALR